jgi:ubiquinone/menaquinone biosynthesis C-methylase UbiE
MTVSFDRVAKIYDTTRWAGVPAPIMEKILAAMKNALKGCKLLLDVGTGTGRFAEFFDSSGFTVVGVDVSLSMMVQAREKGVRNLVRADTHHLPFRDGSFDGSIMIHVLHLVENWVQVIHEVGRVTKKIVISEAGDVQGFNARQRYLELRTEMGYPLNRFNDSEFGLRRVVPPKLVVRAGDYWTDVNTDEEIASFEARKSSVMWDVPIEAHKKIVQQLRAETGGKTLRRHDIPEVVGWDPAKLRAYRP